MALVTQDVTPTRSYTPFEGMSERQRLSNSVPRGLLRFFSNEAVDAKPVNDDIRLSITGSLPPNFAYVISALSFIIEVDTATDWTSFCRFRIFNGIPNGPPSNEQVARFNFSFNSMGVAIMPNSRILEFSAGSLREWFPQPIVRSAGAAGLSFTLLAGNGANAVQAAGAMFFNLSFYQYELNQAVRYPLNAPIPVGIR